MRGGADAVDAFRSVVQSLPRNLPATLSLAAAARVQCSEAGAPIHGRCATIFAYANIEAIGERTLVAAPVDCALRASGLVPTQLWHFGETRFQALEQLGMERVARFCQRVIAPRSLPPRPDQSSAPEVREMTGCGRLRHPQHRHQVADAQLAVLQQAQDAEPGAIGECAEETIHRQTRGLQHVVGAV